LQFAKDYPDSKFAKDAQYLSRLIIFTGSVMAGDKETSSKLIKEMEEFVHLYPDALLAEPTFEKWKGILGDNSSRVLYIPFKLILPYMRGLSAFQFKDYREAIYNFSLLKDSLDFTRDDTGILAEEVYLPLVLSYQLTNNLDKFNEVAKEAIARFPDTHLGQSMQRVLEKNKAQ
jgi:outer membrane protein assembly factor BamD (BamD/ComL family)